MRILTHTVTEADSGQTVRQLLGRLWHISGGFLSRLKFRGAITVNGAPVTVRFVPRPGDLLAADVSDLPGENPYIQPMDYPLDILYEDEDLLLINKPAGVAMHPAALTEEPVTVAGAVAHYLRTDCFHAVNRLDRGTTGVMAAAKTGYIHALCMAQLHTDAFQRDYRAVCEGVPVPGEGDIDLPLGRAEGSRPAGAARPHPLRGAGLGQRTRPAAADSHHRAHPPAAGASGRHRPSPHRRLALRHRGSGADRPPGAAQLPSGHAPPSYRLKHRRYRAPAGGYAATVEGGTSMNFRLLTAKEYPRWYHDQLSEAFVPQERKPLPDILRLLEEGRYEVWGLFDEDELLSYAALWKNATIPLVLLDYLGTTRARRNEGLGSDMLLRLEQQGRPLVAEAEFPVPGGSDAENALRLRRIQFYIRNGFTPAYIMSTCGMVWQALLCGTVEPLENIMAQHKTLYGDVRTDVVIPLPEGQTPQPPYWMI